MASSSSSSPPCAPPPPAPPPPGIATPSIRHSQPSFLCFCCSSLSRASCSSSSSPVASLQVIVARRRRMGIATCRGERNRGCRSHPASAKKSSAVQEEERMVADLDASWALLGQLLGPIGQAEMGAEADCPGEKLWSPALGDDFEGHCRGGSRACDFSLGALVKSTALPLQQQGESDRRKYYLNTGYAIRTLREELPTMFCKDLTYEIYREDIVFRDPMNIFGGLDNYKFILWALRFHGRIFFKTLWVDILRIWLPCEDAIMVRWQVHGVPRVPWEAQGIFDGISEYKLDEDGKIYEHRVDNVVVNSWKKFKALTVADLVGVVTCPSIPRPTFFGRAELTFFSLLLYLLQFTWVHYYLALKGTVGLRNVK